MIYRVRLGNWKITLTLAQTTTTTGINSNLRDGNHILLWDFDDKKLEDVREALLMVQRTYRLPQIRIMNSGKPKNWMASCLMRLSWRKAVEIVTYTPLVDWGFIRFGVFRQHFTQRVFPKQGRKITLAEVLPSNVPESVSLSEVNNWVHYETLVDEEQVKVKEVRLV